MPRLKYDGTATVRTITTEQFREVGVDDQNGFTIDTRSGERTVEVSQKAADILLSRESADWKVVDEPDQEPETDLADNVDGISPEDDGDE